MYSNEREAYRKAFYESWQKHLKKLPLAPVEAQLVDIINKHPEFEKYLSPQNETHFELEENPFLHMSLHLAIHEQIQLDQPIGIQAIYRSLCERDMTAHDVEHRMMDCLAQLMWEAQQTGAVPSETSYIDAIKRLLD